MKTIENKQPWSQLPEESAKAYSRFMDYLFAGGQRSKAAIAKLAGITPAAVTDMADKYSWDERAAHYDTYLNGKIMNQWEEQARALNSLHMEAGRMLFDKAVKMIEKLDPNEKASAADAVRMLESSVKIMRDGGGIPQLISHEITDRDTQDKIFVIQDDPRENEERIKRLEKKLLSKKAAN